MQNINEQMQPRHCFQNFDDINYSNGLIIEKGHNTIQFLFYDCDFLKTPILETEQLACVACSLFKYITSKQNHI